MRWLLPLVFIFTLVFGAPYGALLLYAIMGPWTATATQHDGSVTNMAFGQNLPRPEWVPVIAGASIVQASKLTSMEAPSGFNSLEIATRASLDEIKRFYTEQLSAAGFAVEDLGLMTLNPATAHFLGVDGTLVGKRAATDDLIYVHIRSPEGLIPSRLLQISWVKMSEYPRHAEAGKL